MKRSCLGLAPVALLSLAALGVPHEARAHFILDAPDSWIEENQLGDPQKMAPCGGTLSDGGTRTGAVTQVTGGQMLRLAITETIYHPGHYRVSLARRINWLPGDPEAVMKQTVNGLRSDYAHIDPEPLPPVLVDGLWKNDVQRTGPLETEIRIPNIECDNCFLQVVQFMENHPGFAEGGFTYHHCAVLDITPDESLPIDQRW